MRGGRAQGRELGGGLGRFERSLVALVALVAPLALSVCPLVGAQVRLEPHHLLHLLPK